MQPTILGLVAVIALLLSFSASAQAPNSTTRAQQPAERRPHLPQQEGLQPRAPLQVNSPSHQDQRAPSGTSDPTATHQSIPTPLQGTEYFVTLPQGQGAHDFAKIAGTVTGLPVYVIREIDNRHALLAVDQSGIADQLEKKLRTYGLPVERVPSKLPAIMGRTPPPGLLFRYSEIKKLPPTLIVFHDALAKISNPDQPDKTVAYNELATKISEKTSVPTSVFAGHKTGSVILFPAGELLGSRLSEKISGFKGARAERVRVARPFSKIN